MGMSTAVADQARRISELEAWQRSMGSSPQPAAELAVSCHGDVHPVVDCVDDATEETDGGGYKLEESLWDVSLLCFIEGQEMASSVWTSMLLIVNCAAQAIFTVIVLDQLWEPQIDEGVASGYRTWRTNIGHSSRYFDATRQWHACLNRY